MDRERLYMEHVEYAVFLFYIGAGRTSVPRLHGDRQPPGVPGYGSNGACTADTAEERRLYADGAQTGRADAGAGTTGVRYVTETER